MLTLDQVFPWGRSLNEYVRMFALSRDDLQLRLVDCAGGPASFNAEMHRKGSKVVSCDPLYGFSADEIAQRIGEVRQTMLEETRRNQHNFLWHEFRSPEHLAEIRVRAMEEFLKDFPSGSRAGRYQLAELPLLPFRDREFDLALCSHFLFTYSQKLSLEFHLQSIREMCRVAEEARVFPLLPSFGAGYSPLLPDVIDQLQKEGYVVEVKPVAYEFQRGGNEMVRISKNREFSIVVKPDI